MLAMAERGNPGSGSLERQWTREQPEIPPVEADTRALLLFRTCVTKAHVVLVPP